MTRIFVSSFIVSVVFAHMCAGHEGPLCGANSELRPCGSLCESTCDQPDKISCAPLDKQACRHECRCMDGFARNTKTGECVKLDECPTPRPPMPKCNANERIAFCGRTCEPTCKNPNSAACLAALSPTLTCTQRTQGCRCMDGYVRNGATGRCVKLANCPMMKRMLECPANEHLDLCGRSCEPTCKSPHSDGALCLGATCDKLTEACRCNEGHVRDAATMRCIRRTDCDTCRANEEIGRCGRSCEATCEIPDASHCAALKCQDTGCQCMPGLVRNALTDACIRADQCPMRCALDEILAPCGRTCEGTCANPDLPETCKNMKCSLSGCRCDRDAGMVRDERTGRCIRKEACGHKRE